MHYFPFFAAVIKIYPNVFKGYERNIKKLEKDKLEDFVVKRLKK